MKINGNFYTSNGGQASTFTQTGGTINETGSYLYLSNGGGATAANFSGGVFTSTVGAVLGVRANVTATISGTAAVTLPYLQLGYSSSVDSVVVDILSLNGGTLAVGYVSNGAGTANFNFNGGTLRASGSNASFMTGLSNAYIQGGGATIDSQAYNITIGQALLTSGGTDGGLTKLGAGTLTLSGANTYVGGTTINGGTLVFSGVGSGYNNGNIVIANSANLSILASASSSSFGKSISGTAGTVSFNAYGNTTDSGGGDGGNFTLSNAGTFTGTVVVNTGLIAPSADSAFGNAANVIQLNAPSGGSAGLVATTNLDLPNTRSIQLTTAGGSSIFRAYGSQTFTIDGVISGPGNFVKTDGGIVKLTAANTFSGTTRVGGGTLYLLNSLALQDSTFTAGGSYFDSSVTSHAFTLGGLAGSTNLALQDDAGTPNPVALSVGNNNLNTTYSGVLLNGGSLVKIGTGTLTLTAAETYTGATSINGGTLAVNGSLAAASAVGIGTAGTLAGSGTISGSATLTAGGAIGFSSGGQIAGTLGVSGGAWNGLGTVGGPVTASTGTFTLGSGANLTASSGLNLSGGTLAGAGALTGNTTLTGNGAVSLSSGGQLVGALAANGGFWNGVGSVSGLVTAGTGTFTLGSGANLTANSGLAITGGTLAGSGAVTGNTTLSGNGAINLSGGTLAGNLGATGGNWTGTGIVTGLATASTGTFTLGSGANLTTNSGLAITGGTLAGSGAVAGNTTLSGNGAINLSGGTLAGNLGVTGGNWTGTGTVAGPVTASTGTFTLGSGANLTANSGVNVTGGTLAGPGTITGNATLSGNGVINLSGGNITGTLGTSGGYWTGSGSVGGLITASTGTLTVANGGNLAANGGLSLTGGVLTGVGTVSGGTLTLGAGARGPGATANAGNVGTLTLPSLVTGGGGTVNFDLSSTTASGNDLVAVAGNLSLSGTTTITPYLINGSLATGTPYTLFTYGGAISYSGSPLALAPGILGARQQPTFDYGSGANSAVTLTINGFNASLTWVGTNSSTWVDSTGTLAWTSPTSPAGDFFTAQDSVTFDNTAGTNTSVTLAAVVQPSSVVVTGSNNFTFTGPGSIGNGATLTVVGPGSLTLATTGNTYSGGTVIQGGSVVLGANNALPSGGVLATGQVTLGLAASSGTLDLAGFNQTVSGLAVGSGATAASQVVTSSSGNATLTFSNPGASSVFGGTIQDAASTSGGTLSLTVSGGTLDVSTGVTSYYGATTVNAGQLLVNSLPNTSGIAVGSAGALGVSGANLSLVAVSNSGSVAFTGNSGTITLAGLGGPGAASFAAGANLPSLAAGSITVAGPATIATLSGGTANFNGPTAAIATLGDASVNLGSSTVMSVSTGTQTIAGQITGSGGLAMNGAGPLALAGSNSYSGGTTLASGLLDINSPSALGVGSFTIAGGTIDSTVAGITLAGNAQKWNADVSFNGTQNLNLGPGAVALGGNRTVTVSANTLTVGGGISGAYSLTMAGTGTLALTGASTYSGGTTVSSGTLQIGAGGASGSISGAVAIQNAGTLSLLRSDNAYTVPNTFSGNGTLNLLGTGVSAQSAYAFSNSSPSFTGTVYVNNARLQGTLTNVGNPSMITTVDNGTDGGQVYASYATYNLPLTIAGQGWQEGAGRLGALRIEAATWSGPITLGGNARIGSYGAYSNTISGTMSGPYQVEFWGGNGTPTYTLTGTSTVAATQIDSSVYVVAGSANAVSSGTMTMAGGTLQAHGYNLAFAELNGSSGQIQNGSTSAPSTITVGGDNLNTTYGGTFANGGTQTLSLTKTGTGTLTLSGAGGSNTATGVTTVNAGVLAVGGSFSASGAIQGNIVINNGGTYRMLQSNAINDSSIITVNTGGTLDVNGMGEAIGYLAGGGTVINNTAGAPQFDLGSTTQTFSGSISGAVYVRGGNGSGTQVFAPVNPITLSTLQIGFAGASASANFAISGGQVTDSGDFIVDNGGAAGFSISGGTLIANGANFLTGNTGANTTFTQSGGLVEYTGVWMGLANEGGTQTMNFSGGTFASTAAGMVAGVRGNVNVTLGGSALVTAPYFQFFHSDSVTGSGKTVTVYLNSGTLAVGYVRAGTALSTSVFDFNGGLLQATGNNSSFLAGLTAANVQGGGALVDTQAFNVTIGQALLTSGGTDGGLTKLGAGVLTLSGSNTYVGGTKIEAGTLMLGNAAALGTGPLTANAGTLNLAGYSPTVAGLAGLAGTILTSGTTSVTLTANVASGTATFGGTIANGGGTVALALSGSGTQILTGVNTYTGGTTLNSGSLQLGDGATHNGSVTGNILDNGLLIFANPAPQTYGGLISGTGGLNVAGPAPLVLTNGNNSANGLTTVSGGTLQLGDGASLLGTVGGNISDNATLTFANYAAQTFAGAISGTGALNVNGTATLTLVADSSAFSGTTTITTGTLQLGDGATSNALLGGTVVDNAMLVFANPAAQNFSAPIGGTGGVAVIGPATLTLAASDGYSGGTTVGGGTLLVGNTNALGAGAVVLAGGVLDLGTFSPAIPSLTLTSGTLTGSGGTLDAAVTKNTTGTAYLSGASPLAGASLSLVDGQLLLTSPQSVGSLALTGGTLAGSTLTVTGALPIDAQGGTIAANLAGGAGLNKSTANTVLLSGANSYAGGTSIEGGTLQLGSGAALPAAGSLTVDAGTLDLNGHNPTVGALTGANGIITTSSSGPATLTVNTAAAPTAYNGTISDGSGTIGLVKSGNGSLTLNAANNYSGGTTINAGLLQLGNSGALGSPSGGLMVNAGTLDLAGTSPVVGALNGGGIVTSSATGATLTAGAGDATSNFGGVLTDGVETPVALVKVGSGTLTLSGANGYGGGTTIGGGELSISSSSNLGSGNVTIGAGALQTTGTVVLDAARTLTLTDLASTIDTPNLGDSVTVTGPVIGSGALNKIGAGTLALANPSGDTYTGNTYVAAGTLVVAADNALSPVSNLVIADGASVVLGFGGGDSAPDIRGGLPPFAAPSLAAPALSPAGISTVPEPSTLALLVAAGVAGLIVWRRRG